MKKTIGVVLLVITLSGCKGEAPTVFSATPVGSLILSYTSGFKGDSIILFSDRALLLRDKGFSDSIGVSNGWLLTVPVGQHLLEMWLPQENVRAQTSFPASQGMTTTIDAHYDRNQKKITFDIYFRMY